MTSSRLSIVNEKSISNIETRVDGNGGGRLHDAVLAGTHPDGWLPTWDGASYAANTSHHRALDGWFLQHFPSRRDDVLLDIGCGSGDFTAVVAGLVADGEVVGAEPQASLLDHARAVMRPNQRFEQVSAQQLDTVFPLDSFDAVFSRAVFQWIPGQDYPGIFSTVRKLIKPGGWFRLECGGAGNIRAILPLLAEVSLRHAGPPPPWTFLDPGTILDMLQATGFVLVSPQADGMAGYVNSVAQRRPFTREALIGWMRSQCFQGFEIDMPPANHVAYRAEVEDRIDELQRRGGTYDLTYVRIDALVYRPA